MKITKRQLRKLINEIQIKLSDAEVTAAKQKLEDEGGAAGLDMIAKAINAKETNTPFVCRGSGKPVRQFCYAPNNILLFFISVSC